MLKKIYDWMGTKVHSRFATPFLAFLFFVEAIFFVPTDPILILFCLERRKKTYWYATLATIASVCGGMVAYWIGFSLWNAVGPQIINSTFVRCIMSQETFHYLCFQYDLYSHWAVLFAGFSPIPYKAATLSAGFCQISFVPFVLFSLIARGARFFLVAWIIKRWGVQIKKYIDRYFTLLVVLFLIILGVAVLICT